MLRPALLALALVSTPLVAADRTIGVGSFDRLRVDGAFEVRMTTGGSPRAKLSGDPHALELVDVQVNGSTLSIRRRADTVAAVRTAGEPVVVTLSAPTLTSAVLIGSGAVRVSGMRGERADLSVAGTGTITVEGLATEQASATVVGSGAVVLAGRARRLRLSTNGPGAIDASKLVADDLTVRLDGPGETLAQARYVATVSTTGAGRVVVTGNAKCTVRAPSGGAVVCGGT